MKVLTQGSLDENKNSRKRTVWIEMDLSDSDNNGIQDRSNYMKGGHLSVGLGILATVLLC